MELRDFSHAPEKVAELAKHCLELFGYSEFLTGQSETIMSFVTSNEFYVQISGTGTGKVSTCASSMETFRVLMKAHF